MVATVNDPPTANDDGVPTPLQVAEALGPRPLDVLANDTALPDEGETLTIVGVTQGANGAVAITAGGSGLTYDPADAYTGADTFTYTISDGLLEATATVFVDVLVDVTAPATSIRVVAAGTPSSPSVRVGVTWSAVELLSGVSLYQLQQQTDGGAWTTIVLSPVTATRIQRTVARGHVYAFRVRAKDGSNNLGSYATSRPLRL
jgi:Bacterial Ig domain